MGCGVSMVEASTTQGQSCTGGKPSALSLTSPRMQSYEENWGHADVSDPPDAVKRGRPSPGAGRGGISPANGNQCRQRRRVTNVMTLFRKHVDDFERSMKDGPHRTEERLRRIFDLIDMDGNGTLNMDEVQQFWHKMGWASSERSLKAMFNVADKDGSGAIEWHEFQKFFGTLTSLRDLATPDPDLEWVPPSAKRDRRTSTAA
eukprot:Rhum_TRINITY_DN11435_c0_g1::Rhum_TRINITY_DN11435_c0_g1_i1::g.44395::m.44395